MSSNLGSAAFFSKDISLIRKSEFSDIDVCVLNPPFGTTDNNKKLDVVFLKKAIKLSNKVVSMHKTASKKFICGVFKDGQFEIIYKKEFLFPIPKTYSYHSEEIKDVEVTLFIAEKQ
jgi:predicted RNA methylase